MLAPPDGVEKKRAEEPHLRAGSQNQTTEGKASFSQSERLPGGKAGHDEKSPLVDDSATDSVPARLHGVLKHSREMLSSLVKRVLLPKPPASTPSSREGA